MDHVVSAVENALTSGRWNDAAPLLSDLLANGVPCVLKPLSDYEKLAGRECTDDRVRFHLTSRLRMLDDRQWSQSRRAMLQSEKLAQVVRDHGYPCRVVAHGAQLRVASSYLSDKGNWVRVIEQIDATESTVSAWLGY